MNQVGHLFIVESQINGRKIEEICTKIKLCRCYRMGPLGKSGGVWVLWDYNLLVVDATLTHRRFIYACVKTKHKGSILASYCSLYFS